MFCNWDEHFWLGRIFSSKIDFVTLETKRQFQILNFVGNIIDQTRGREVKTSWGKKGSGKERKNRSGD